MTNVFISNFIENIIFYMSEILHYQITYLHFKAVF